MCDDFSVCTIDSCDPDTGCVYDYVSCGEYEMCDAVKGCVAMEDDLMIDHGNDDE